MASILSTQNLVLATSIAVSGTAILLANCLKKSLSNTLKTHHPSKQTIRSSTSSDEIRKPYKKKVRFAEDVMRSDVIEDFGRENGLSTSSSSLHNQGKIVESCEGNTGMPANRVAMYTTVLRERLHLRLSHSY